MKPEIQLHWWHADKERENFGDYYSKILAESLGYSVRALVSAKGKEAEGTSCYCLAGSVITPSNLHFARDRGVRLKFYGCGIHYIWDLAEGDLLDTSTFYSFRGPETARNIPKPSLALGDSLLLIPHLFPEYVGLKKTRSCLFVNHYWTQSSIMSHPDVPSDTKEVSTVLEGTRKREHWFALLRDIATSRFVITQSLHAAVVAQSLGIPWAPCSTGTLKGKLDSPTKWQDWFGYLGLPQSLSSIPLAGSLPLSGCRTWWEEREEKLRGKQPSTAPLVGALPLPVLKYSVQRRLNAAD